MRTGLIALVAALPAAVAALVPAAGASPAAAPALRFADLTPAMARGSHFAPGTKVRVTLVAGETKRSRLVRVAAGGGFLVAFGIVPRDDRCSGKVMLVASSASGQRASYRLPPMACTTVKVDKATDKAVDAATDKATSKSVDKSTDGASR